MKTKILIGVSSSYCANFLKGQIQFLNKNNYDVVIISGEGEEISLLAKEESATLYTVAFTQKYSVLTDFFILRQIVNIIKKENPDIINAGNPKSGFLIMLAAYLLKRKNRIFTLHGLLSDTKTGLIRYLVEKMETLCCYFSHITIVVSKSLMQHAIDRKIVDPKKAIILSNGSTNGINTNTFNKTEELIVEAKQLQKNLNLDPKKFTIGFVGRVSYDKGLTQLLDVFIALKKEIDIQLVIIGPISTSDPIDKKHLHLLYNEPDVFYLGKILHVAPYYAMFNVLLLPSLREGFGNVLIEAAAMQVPVLASDIPGIRDAVDDTKNGFLVPLQNNTAIANKIKMLYNDKNLQKQMGINGRNFVTQNYTNEQVWKAYLEIYKTL